MNIFHQIKNSVYGKDYYKDTVLNESVNQSIKYLAKLSLLVSLLGIVIITCFIPSTVLKIKGVISVAVSNYPDDLVVTIDKGLASINQPEPYFIKIPVSLNNTKSNQAVKFDNLVTLNTSEPFSIEKFKEYSTLILLTKKEFISMDNSAGGLKITSIASFPNVTISKTWLHEKENYLIKMMPVFAIVILAFLYLGLFLMMFVGTLIILFFYALVVWGLFKLNKNEVSYKKSYQIALHAATITLIVTLIGLFIQPINNAWLKVVILIIIIYLNFFKFPFWGAKEEIVVNTEKGEEIIK